MSGIIHQKQDPNAIRATGTLEKRSPGDQAVQVLLYVLIALRTPSWSPSWVR